MAEKDDQTLSKTEKEDDPTLSKTKNKERSWPNHWSYRYVILLLVCYTQFAGFYCVESPAGLKEIIIGVMNIDNTHYTLLFSATAWINIVLCLLAGIMVDKVIGVQIAFVIFTATTLIGQATYTFGSVIDNFWITLLGRALLGTGNELRNLVALTIQGLWFKQNMELSISLSFFSARLGGFIALSVPSFLYSQLRHCIHDSLYRLGTINMIGVILMIVSLGAAILTAIFDWKGVQLLGERQPMNKSFSFREMKNFSLLFWPYAIAFAIQFPVFSSFSTIGQSFYMYRYNFDIFQASEANSLMFGGVLIFSPIIGFLVNSFGYSGYWSMCSTPLFLFATMILVTSPQYIWIPFVGSTIISLSYTIFTISILSLPVYMVQENQLSIAYGIVRFLTNVFLSIITVVSGVLIDHNGYFILELFYSVFTYVTMSLLIMAVIMEFGEDERKVNLSKSERKQLTSF